MIVYQNHRMGLPGQRGPERLAWMEQAFVQRSAGHFLHGQDLVLGVQADHPDAFVVEQAHFLAEQTGHIGRGVNRPGLRLAPRQSSGKGKAALSPMAFA